MSGMAAAEPSSSYFANILAKPPPLNTFDAFKKVSCSQTAYTASHS